MLDLGFEQDVRDIIGYCAAGGERQTAMFSATWPKSIRDLAAEFLRNPVKVSSCYFLCRCLSFSWLDVIPFRAARTFVGKRTWN